jgi:uncharacterized protein YggT (Ycf19 family)
VTRENATMSSTRPVDPTVQEYEDRAEAAERSPVPVFLKIGRAIVWIVYALVLITALLLTLAFFLRLFGANPDSGFVEWVYRSVERAMQPFRGIFPTHPINDTSVLDFSLLFAAICYFVVALLVDIALRWLTHRLKAQERKTAELRAQADLAAYQAAAQRNAADQSVREAAAREYAAQQAAAQQYAIAQAAAREVVAQHTGPYTVPAQAVAAKPAPPQPRIEPEPPAPPTPLSPPPA